MFQLDITTGSEWKSVLTSHPDRTSSLTAGHWLHDRAMERAGLTIEGGGGKRKRIYKKLPEVGGCGECMHIYFSRSNYPHPRNPWTLLTSPRKETKA
ncbi:hypothetical protein RRG08_048064 [Elysia crispata]|uniref:Uncharacterized protein n=1 Tax=Elysia crispata TaxID=231223 RepID=A0AAE1D9G9_9GAST|nr:hypothetical protein RRG08_048064 [Elysia crispata]